MICARIECIACYEYEDECHCGNASVSLIEYQRLQVALKREKSQHNVEVEILENEIELLEAKLLAANSQIFMLTQK